MNEYLKETMEEGPVPDNHGRRARDLSPQSDDDTTPTTRLMNLDPSREEFLREDGWFIERGTAHRGVLHGDEYVDFFDLRAKVEVEFGFTYAEVSAAYKGGRPAADMRQMREQIDARMLALSHAGGSMITLAEALGLNEKTIDRALARARERHVEEIVKAPAVTSTLVCFITGEPGARRRKRRHSTSPEAYIGTVNLSDEAYARGFNPKPGNPAYWEHRDALRPIKSSGHTPAPKVAQKFPADWPSDESYREFVGTVR